MAEKNPSFKTFKDLIPAPIFIPCVIDEVKQKAGDIKPYKPACSWKEGQEENLKAREADTLSGKYACIGILTGKSAGISVVDFDSDEALERFERLCGKKESVCNLIMKTRRGYQLFFKYNPNAKNGTIYEKTDIRNDGGLSWAVPGNKNYELFYSGDSLTELTDEMLRKLSGAAVTQVTQQESGPVFKEAKIIPHDPLNPLIRLLEAAVAKDCDLTKMQGRSAELLLGRLFNGSKSEYSAANKEGNRNNTCVRLMGIFLSDPTISHKDIFTTCTEFIEKVVAPEEGAAAKVATIYNTYSHQMVYDERWERKLEEAQKAERNPALTIHEKKEALHEADARIKAMEEALTYVGYDCEKGKFFVCMAEKEEHRFTGGKVKPHEAKMKLTYLSNTGDKQAILFTLKPLIEALGFELSFGVNSEAAAKIVLRSLAVCCLSVTHESKRLFGFYLNGAFVFNASNEWDGSPTALEIWEKVKKMSEADLEAYPQDEDLKSIIYAPIKDEEDTDYFLKAFAEKLDMGDDYIPFKHHHITSRTQGSGKSILTKCVPKVFYNGDCIEIESGSLYSQFNTQFANAEVVVFDDIKKFAENSNAIMKTYIGTRSYQIHSKNKEPYSVKNKLFSCGSSNDKYPTKSAAKGERRLAWYEGVEEKRVDIPEILAKHGYVDAVEYLKDRTWELCVLIRKAQLRCNADLMAPFHPEKQEELAAESPENIFEYVAQTLINYSAKRDEESFTKFDMAVTEDVAKDASGFVEFVKGEFEAGCKVLARKDLINYMTRKAYIALRRFLLLNGVNCGTNYSRKYAASVYGFGFGEEEKSLFEAKSINFSGGSGGIL